MKKIVRVYGEKSEVFWFGWRGGSETRGDQVKPELTLK